MGIDFLPARESDLLGWSANFRDRISIDPPSVGLTTLQASNFAALLASFEALYSAAHDNSARTPTGIVKKNDAKRALKSNARVLVRIVQAVPTLTSGEKATLGLTLRNDSSTPVPAPTSSPMIDIVATRGRTVSIRLHDSLSMRRGKPRAIAGAALFSFVGDEHPVRMEDWKFEGNVTAVRSPIDVHFDASVPSGSVVWFTAMWVNPRLERGPAAIARCINLPGGIAMPRSLAA